MRVLMVTPGYYPIKGGTEAVVESLAVELNRVGINADVMTFNMNQKWHPEWKGKTEEVNGVIVHKIPALNWLPIEHSPRITLNVNVIPGRYRRLLAEYDIIHFHETEFSFPLFSFFVKKPKIFHLHGIDTEFFKRYFLSRLILKHVADLYISVSRRMKQDLIELGIPENRTVHLPNSIDTKVFCPGDIKSENLVLFVGRITAIKGLHILLRSLNYIEQKVNLIIIGPMGSNVQYAQSIQKLMMDENLNHKHKITYMGPKDKTEIIKWYQRASLVVSPSLTEAFGLVNLEAMACGTPVIATNVGGIPEVVRNCENGLLVPPNNALKLAKAIQCLLDDKDLRSRFGENGRRRALNNFSLEVIVNKVRRIYQTMVETTT